MGTISLRPTYVRAVHLGRRVARRTSLLPAMEDSRRPFVRHLRTLLSIYDAEDLASLDLPWWTYRAVREVEDLLASREHPRVFEYGTGASTVWLSRRAAHVHTVEHDRDFADLMQPLLDPAGNVTLHVVPPAPVPDGAPAVTSGRGGHENLDFGDYVATIDRVGGEFDLVVVDGRARVDCVRRALGHVAPGGMVLLDDAGRRRYRSVFDLDGVEFTRLAGAKPCVPYRSVTAVARVAAA